MRIKNKPKFCLGIINCVLGLLCVVTMIAGKSSGITGIAMVTCLLSGIGLIIDNLERR